MASRYVLRLAIALVALIIGVHKRDAVYHPGSDRGTEPQAQAAPIPSRPTCNPVTFDAASMRYGEGVVTALGSYSKVGNVKPSPTWSRRQLMARFLAAARAGDRVVRAIDDNPPPTFPLAATFGDLRNAMTRESDAFRQLRRATADGDRTEMLAAREAAMEAYVELTSVQTQLKRLRDAPPCT